MDKDKPCRRCSHPFGDHCKGNVAHAYHKNASQYIPSAMIHCTKPHCEIHPLCSCTGYIGNGAEFVRYMQESVAIYGQCTVLLFQLDLLGDGKHDRAAVLSSLRKKSKLAYEEFPHVYVFKEAA